MGANTGQQGHQEADASVARLGDLPEREVTTDYFLRDFFAAQ
jgi:hypothetical protein